MKVWAGPSAASSALVGGNLLLVFLVLSRTALAQEAQGGVGAHTGILLGAFWFLLGVMVTLLVWEVLERQYAPPHPPLQQTPSPATEGTPAAGEEAPPLLEEEDPFKALLRKTAAEKESAGQGAAGVQGEPSLPRPAGATAPARMTEPVPSERAEDIEELSPFQRLAQIGAEETAPVPSLLPESRPEETPAPSPGGDWAALLSKVQAEEEKQAPLPRVPLKAEEDDPWKKLLGQTAAAESSDALKTEVAEDPWKALLSKAASDSQSPLVSESPDEQPSGPPAPPPRIQLDPIPSPPAEGETSPKPAEDSTPPTPAEAETSPKPAEDSTPPTPAEAETSPKPAEDSTSPKPAEAETGRPRTISLKIKREKGRPKIPPPQTEEE
ncbi:MAG: hypothetical protein ACOX9B_02555 [Candidatus Xenobium sp.]